MKPQTQLVALDLFSGIGGFALGLERSGISTAAFCECDGYARRVLKKHWPTAWMYDDIRTLTAKRLRQDGIDVNIISGGFPCQDISGSGRGAGIQGKRSGLWKEYARLIREIRPKYAIMENVSALRSRGLKVVVGDLAAIGYDAEWHCIPASAIDAPHQRDRIWIVAYPHRVRRQGIQPQLESRESKIECNSGNKAGTNKASGIISNSQSNELSPQLLSYQNIVDFTASRRIEWSAESAVQRVADGVPNRVDRLKCIGNSVVPQIVEIIGRQIVKDWRSLGGE